MFISHSSSSLERFLFVLFWLNVWSLCVTLWVNDDIIIHLMYSRTGNVIYSVSRKKKDEYFCCPDPVRFCSSFGSIRWEISWKNAIWDYKYKQLSDLFEWLCAMVFRMAVESMIYSNYISLTFLSFGTDCFFITK